MRKKPEFRKREKPFAKKGASTASSVDQTENTEVVMGELVEFKTPASKEGMKEHVATSESRVLQSRELTPREIQQRDRDCKVEYSAVVPSGMHKALDESRRANWIPPSEVEKMPQWKPVMQPAVDQVIAESVKEVAAWMDTVIREEKEKMVDKLVPKVLKRLPGHDKELVAKRIWGTLYELQREQGVSNKHLIGRVISK